MISDVQLREFFRLQLSIQIAYQRRQRDRPGTIARRNQHNYIRCLCRRARQARYQSGCYPEAKPPKGCHD